MIKNCISTNILIKMKMRYLKLM